jgi:N-acyl-phosphatidylethanolamine-hydrolysing phospholipase D
LIFIENGFANVIQDIPQRKGHRFENPWPSAERHGFRDVLRWALERRTRRPQRPEAGRIESALQLMSPSFEMPRASPESLTATWIGHTTVLIQLAGINILTDPIWSQRASPLPFAGPKRHSAPGVHFDSLPIIDVVLISHDHYDHLDSRTVDKLISRFPAAAWRAPLGVAAFIRDRGAKDVKEMTWHQTDGFCGVDFTCVPAQHFSGRGLFNRNHTLWCGWVLRAPGHSVFFAGDTALNPSFARTAAAYGPLDLALMPIGAYDPRWFMRAVHMDPEECVDAVRMLAGNSMSVPTVLATHWGTFKLTDEPLAEPPLRMAKAWAAAGFPPEKLWIFALGQTGKL